MTRFQTPPILTGSQKDQLIAIRRYLFTMSRDLERALTNLDESNFAPDTTAHTVVSGGLGAAARADIASQTAQLKSLIIKSADTVRAEIDRISAQLDSKYTAASDFGGFTQNISATLEATAQDMTAVYDYYAALNARLDSVSTDFEDYTLRTGGYIKSGIVGYKEDGLTPIFGIAVGQGISTTTVNIDGVEHEQIDTNPFLSVFTADRLSFRQSDVEVAYLSDEKLFIAAAHITGSLELANKWELSARSGFTLKWIG